MKKLLFSLVILFNAILAHAQWPEFNQAHPVSCQWSPFNYRADGYFENVFVVNSELQFLDGYIAFGNGVLCSPSNCENYIRCYSTKFNTVGQSIWWNRYDNPLEDKSQRWFSSISGNSGGMIQNHNNQIVSFFSSFVNSDLFNWQTQDFLVTMDLQGLILDSVVFDLTLAEYNVRGVVEDYTDSTYIVYGQFRDSIDVVNNSWPISFLSKVDSTGNIIWQSEYINTSKIWSVSKARDGGFWITAEKPNNFCSDLNFANTDVAIIKTDELGNESARIEFGGVCGDELATCYEFEDDRVIVAGRLTLDEVNIASMPWEGFFYTTIIEQQSNGSLNIVGPMKKYIPSLGGSFIDFHPLLDGSFVFVMDAAFVEEFETSSIGRVMGSLLKLNNARDSLWCKKYTYYNNPPTIQYVPFAKHYLLDSKPTLDGGFVCVGKIIQQQQDPNPNLITPWIFKVDSMGCLEPGCQYVNVEEIVVGLENTITVFPNPARDQVKLNFTFPDNYVPNNQNEIVIIDMQGREVLRENIFLFASSSNTIEINISSLSSGMYTLHWLSNNAWLDSSKVVVE
jgi:hypothetical protein